MTIAVAACCLVAAGLSILHRARARLALVQAGLSEDARSSPFSDAIRDMVALAGGIYLGLLMLTSFLQIDVPASVGWGVVHFEPIAGLAFVLAVIQPFVLALLSGRRPFG